MEHPDSKETDDEKAANTSADNAESASDTSAPQPWPNTAIERQIVTASALRYGKRTPQEAAGRTKGRRKTIYSTDRRKSHRFRLAIFLVFFLLVVAGLILVFTDLGRPPQDAVSAIPQMAGQTAATDNPSPTSAPLPASVAQTTVSKNIAEVSTSAELSIPIADVSLRNRPDLLEQLVQVYRSKLADNPNDSAALTALKRLRERSLAELETIIAEGNDSIAGKSLQVVSRLFPELAENPRYKYLIVRMDYIHRQATDEPAAKREHSTPLATTSSPEKTVSAPIDSAPTIAKKAVENAPSLKPEIRAVSITPGRMAEGRFISSDGGNVLMVEISYRNFDKVFEDSSEVTLVTRLGVPGDSMVLAETPVVINGDRGTKSFLIETLTPGNTGDKYQLNFLLNGEFFASRMVRVSISER